MRYSSLADMLPSLLQICDPGLSRILLSAGIVKVVEQSLSELLLSFLLNLQTITTPPALSVINLDILPLPHPEILAPSGDWPLSSNNAASASNKCSRTVSADDMNVDITLPSVPASNSVPSVPSGLPKVAC
ncbi:hypothetical protein RhiirA1_467685 [Rhizophagus irregularis]|uniref:Uncharacterized protein n=1 Tax=Rhizophagus irregularis TaxID=588596 RepID=A0A2I1FM44_9GLOM|nr:hypothetical protein RhiirA1_467685 [Rhizophagus irregularis]PKY35451.1 hypothetical protein RhiirB3_456265 [Rhizophagus irregularis]